MKPTEVSKKIEVIKQMKKGNPPGPGAYLKDKLLNKAATTSSFFVSRVPRDKQDAMLYQRRDHVVYPTSYD